MNKKAFTLIELLVTVLIIMILAGYALFAYREALNEADNTRAKAKLEVISAGYERFRLSFPNTPLTGTFAGDITVLGTCDRADNTWTRLINCGYVPKANFETIRYNFTLDNTRARCNCGPDNNCDGRVIMVPKAGVNLGGRFGADYCAGIDLDKGGRASDGTLSGGFTGGVSIDIPAGIIP